MKDAHVWLLATGGFALFGALAYWADAPHCPFVAALAAAVVGWLWLVALVGLCFLLNGPSRRISLWVSCPVGAALFLGWLAALLYALNAIGSRAGCH